MEVNLGNRIYLYILTHTYLWGFSTDNRGRYYLPWLGGWVREVTATPIKGKYKLWAYFPEGTGWWLQRPLQDLTWVNYIHTGYSRQEWPPTRQVVTKAPLYSQLILYDFDLGDSGGPRVAKEQLSVCVQEQTLNTSEPAEERNIWEQKCLHDSFVTAILWPILTIKLLCKKCSTESVVKLWQSCAYSPN